MHYVYLQLCYLSQLKINIQIFFIGIWCTKIGSSSYCFKTQTGRHNHQHHLQQCLTHCWPCFYVGDLLATKPTYISCCGVSYFLLSQYKVILLMGNYNQLQKMSEINRLFFKNNRAFPSLIHYLLLSGGVRGC